MLPSPKPATVVIPKTGPLSLLHNIPLQANCHAIVTNNDLWIAAAGWGIVIFLVGIVFFAGAPLLVSLFTRDAHVVPIAVECLKYVSLGYPFYAWGMIMEQAFNGAGDTWTPTKINLVCYWMLQIPTAWWLSQRAGYGPRGVYLAICSAETILALVAVLMFRRGRWKSVSV